MNKFNVIDYHSYNRLDAKTNLAYELESNYKNYIYYGFIIIHGYGSTGQGGAIRKHVRGILEEEIKKGRIANVLYGEDIYQNKTLVNKLKALDKGIAEYLKNNNEGITICLFNDKIIKKIKNKNNN
jgi:hypothetical protein